MARSAATAMASHPPIQPMRLVVQPCAAAPAAMHTHSRHPSRSRPSFHRAGWTLLLYGLLSLLLLSPALPSRAQEGEEGDPFSTGLADSVTGASDASSGPFDEGASGVTLEPGWSSGGFFNESGDNSTDAISPTGSGMGDGDGSSSGGGGGSVPPPSSTGPKPDIIPPGGSIGNGASSFGSTDAVFLTTVFDVWIGVILWTMVFTAFGFFGAAVHAVRVSKSIRWLWLWLPPLMLLIGGAIGFFHGAASAALIGAISIAIPYPVGIDIAAGLGIGQAICIIYFHLGRADFIHR